MRLEVARRHGGDPVGARSRPGLIRLDQSTVVELTRSRGPSAESAHTSIARNAAGPNPESHRGDTYNGSTRDDDDGRADA
jgi:hypothetical protein